MHSICIYISLFSALDSILTVRSPQKGQPKMVRLNVLIRKRNGSAVFFGLILCFLLWFLCFMPQTTEKLSLQKFREIKQHDLYRVSKLSKSWEIYDKTNIRETGSIFPKSAKIPMTINSPYIIANQRICRGFRALTYVVIIHSAASHFDRRASLRRTWANDTMFKHTNSRTVFFLGKPTDKGVQEEIYRENAIFNDIVQGAFMDEYKNLTLKAVLGLRWISENCRNAKFIIKADDDVFVNIPEVMTHVFPTLSANSKEIVCFADPSNSIIRSQHHRWRAPYGYFTGLKTYPMPFCYGFVVFFSFPLAVELFQLAKSTPAFVLDDIYVYGILASKVEGITWRNARYSLLFSDWLTEISVYLYNFRNPILAGTANSNRAMQWLWKTFL